MSVGARLPSSGRPIEAEVRVPPSKSLTNRALVAAATAGGGEILNPLSCDDTRLLAEALSRCGWRLSWPEVLGAREIDAEPEGDAGGVSRSGEPPRLSVGPRTVPAGEVTIDLGNSGTGARLLLAFLAAVPGRCVIDGSARLRERPMAPLIAALRGLGADLEGPVESGLPAVVSGRTLEGGTVSIAPGSSSQFVSALMMMAPLTRRGLEIRVEGPLPSRPYLDLTADVLRAFGAVVASEEGGRTWRVGAGGLQPRRFPVEGDWSAAAFFFVAASVSGGAVTVGPLERSSAQGDRAAVSILERAGARVRWGKNTITVSGPLKRPFEANLENTPDLFPALAVAAAAGPPGSRLRGLENLRFKESDRLNVMAGNLRRLGAEVTVEGGVFAVESGITPGHEGTPVTAAGDHRIAMAMAVAALRAGELVLDDAACVAKSFPDFWDEWRKVTG